MKERNYGLDLLRIVSMIAIITGHILIKCKIVPSIPRLSANYNVSWFLIVFAYFGLDSFAIITGYFGVKNRVRYSHLVNLWLEVFFYSVLIAVFFFLYSGDVSVKQLIKSFFPVSTKQYWYFTAYFGLFLFTPLLNEAVRKTDKKTLFVSMTVLLAVFTTIPCIQRDVFELNSGFSTLCLILLYLVGAVISQYDLLSRLTKKTALIALTASLLTVWLSKLCIELVLRRFGNTSGGGLFSIFVSPPIICGSVCLLYLFENIRLDGIFKKAVAFLSPLSFSVYIIHDNEILQEHTWTRKFYGLAEASPLVLAVSVIGISLLFFAGCTAIDYFRSLLFKKLKIVHRLDLLEKKLLKEN